MTTRSADSVDYVPIPSLSPAIAVDVEGRSIRNLDSS